jgi:hypothetical protein
MFVRNGTKKITVNTTSNGTLQQLNNAPTALTRGNI